MPKSTKKNTAIVMYIVVGVVLICLLAGAYFLSGYKRTSSNIDLVSQPESVSQYTHPDGWYTITIPDSWNIVNEPYSGSPNNASLMLGKKGEGTIGFTIFRGPSNAGTIEELEQYVNSSHPFSNKTVTRISSGEIEAVEILMENITATSGGYDADTPGNKYMRIVYVLTPKGVFELQNMGVVGDSYYTSDLKEWLPRITFQ